MMRALTFSTPKVVGVEIGRKAAKQRVAEEAEATTKDRAQEGWRSRQESKMPAEMIGKWDGQASHNRVEIKHYSSNDCGRG